MDSEDHEELRQRHQAPGQWVPTEYGLRPKPVEARRALFRRAPRLLRAAVRPLMYSLLAAGFGLLGGFLGQEFLGDGSASSSSPEGEEASLTAEGVTLDVRWGDVPQRLVAEGVLDLDKFSAAAQAAGSPLTPEQLKVLSEGSDDTIRFDADNAYFLLDVLWALGLANKNEVLTEGPMAQQDGTRPATTPAPADGRSA